MQLATCGSLHAVDISESVNWTHVDGKTCLSTFAAFIRCRHAQKELKRETFFTPKKIREAKNNKFLQKTHLLFCLAGENRDFVAVVVAWHFWQNPADWQVNESLPRYKAKGYREEFRQAIDAAART